MFTNGRGTKTRPRHQREPLASARKKNRPPPLRLATLARAHPSAVLVDERDPRLRVRIAGDEPDEQRDQQRVGEEQSEQKRRAPQDQRVLAEQQRDAAHPASARASYSSTGPANATSPSRSATTRSACRSTSSACCVT